MTSIISKIDRFWRWFSRHSADLAHNPNLLIRDLEERLFAIVEVDWEVGPGITKTHLFSLSPRGDFELLYMTTTIIERAPDLPDWQFSAAKLPRQWNLQVQIDHDGTLVEIDANQWEYLLYRFKDGTFNLLLKPDNRKVLSQEELELAAITIVDGELGEQKRMLLVGEIVVVGEWDATEAPHVASLRPKILARLMKSSADLPPFDADPAVRKVITNETISLKVPLGDLALSDAMRPHFFRLRKLLRSHCAGPYSRKIDEFALVLRISGDILGYRGEGCQNLRLGQKLRYITMDLVMPRSSWERGSPAEIKEFLANCTREAIEQMASKLKKEKIEIYSNRLQSDVYETLSHFIATSRTELKMNAR
jgi:hypothetical protein